MSFKNQYFLVLSIKEELLMIKYKLFLTFLLFLYSNNIFGSEIIDIEIGVKNNRLINHCQENLQVFVHNS